MTDTEMAPMRETEWTDHPTAAPETDRSNSTITPARRDDPMTEHLRSGMVCTSDLQDLAPPQPLIANLLNRNSLAALYGPPGIGKSFATIDWSLHIAHAMRWQDRAVTGGPVVYVMAEGASGIRLRVDAWQRHHGFPAERFPIHWYPSAIDLTSWRWAKAMGELCAELGAVLVVIDTLARNIVGAEENSAQEMGRIVENLDLIRRPSGACVVAVHHTGKDASLGGRGSSALRGALDTELQLSGDSKHMRLKVTKQKDGPEASPIALGLVAVPGAKSVAIGHPTSLPAVADSPSKTLAALVSIDTAEGVTSGAWMAATPGSTRTFYRHREELVLGGHVANVGRPNSPRYRPTMALDAQGDQE